MLIDRKRCQICGICADVCPKGAISIPGGGDPVPKVDRSKCVECGECARECPGDAITPEPLEEGQK